jgi:hypothetical protein
MYGCRAIRQETKMQRGFTVVLACPRKDLMRVWPLAVVEP